MRDYPHLHFSSDGSLIRVLERYFNFLLETFGGFSLGQRGVSCDNFAQEFGGLIQVLLVDPLRSGNELSGFTSPWASDIETHLDGLRESPRSPAALSMHWIAC